MDAAFQAKYLGIARMLWECSEGDPSRIPEHYAEHLSYSYSDGDVSLGHLLPKFDGPQGLEDYEIDEAIELLGKVRPGDWPDPEYVESICPALLLSSGDAPEEEEFDFVEDNLSTAEKVEKTLAKVIESVFHEEVTEIRSEKGYFPNPKNNFLQEDDGTFAGTFKHGDYTYLFEVAPKEDGWIVTYRMHWDSIKKLPPIPKEDDKTENDYTRRLRHRGWK